MAHHWCAPPIYRLPTSLGALKTQQISSLSNKRGNLDRRSSPFPDPPQTRVYQLDLCRVDVHLTEFHPYEDILMATPSKLALTKTGKMIGLSNNEELSLGIPDGTKIVHVTESSNRRCFLTERGILLTQNHIQSTCEEKARIYQVGTLKHMHWHNSPICDECQTQSA